MTNWIPIEEFVKDPKEGEYWVAFKDRNVKRGCVKEIEGDICIYVDSIGCFHPLQCVQETIENLAWIDTEKPPHPSKTELD